MPVALGASRRLVLILILVLAAIGSMIYVSSSAPNAVSKHVTPSSDTPGRLAGLSIEQVTSTGSAIAPKLGNETLKAELGRAAWKLLHTTMARFPDAPTADESQALKSYVYLFQRLYPCGECAEHFGELLRKFPPQVSSRSAASVWACHVHNEVNKSLKKEVFDCSKIGEWYDCGCAADEDAGKGKKVGKSGKKEMSEEAKERMVTNGRDFDVDLLTGDRPLQLKKEGLMRGG